MMRRTARKISAWIERVKVHLSWKQIIAATVAIVAIAWPIFLQEAAKRLFAKLFSDSPALTYEIVSADRLVVSQLSEYASQEFGGVFNLQLDDNILREYEIFKVRIRNDGGPIDHGFTVEAVINDGLGKIVDLKHVIRAPANKSIPITYALPNVWWSTKQSGAKAVFAWTYTTNEQIVGSFLYRSSYKEFGYGKFNLGLIKTNCLPLNIKDVLPGYYAVLGVGINGALSNLSAPVRFPESLAFQPKFKDVVWIDPLYKSEKDCSINDPPTYASLKEAIDREGPKRTFIIRAARADGHKLLNLPGVVDQGARILFEDDFKFLKGKFELSFPDGLDSYSEIDFYFLTKGLPDVQRNLRLLLHGQPKLPFTIRNEIYNAPLKVRAPDVDAKKVSLTPKVIFTYATKNSILIVLPGGDIKTYEGMRIFRNPVNISKSMTRLGEEIYDGKGVKGALFCYPNKANPSRTDVEVPLYDRVAPSEPPTRPLKVPKKIQEPNIVAPAAPGGLIVDLPIPGGNTPTYFEDNTAQDKVKYKYTIYAYDANDTYSYPIEIYASRTDELSGLDCRLLATSDKKSSK
jgi:hypothetical protein